MYNVSNINNMSKKVLGVDKLKSMFTKGNVHGEEY